MDLHGEDDWAKMSCAACGEPIESGETREGDKYGNLYCDLECKAVGQDHLIDLLSGDRQSVAKPRCPVCDTPFTPPEGDEHTCPNCEVELNVA